MKVLILGVAAVQYDAILQLRAMGCETFAIAMAKDGPGADAAHHFSQINILDEEEVVNHIITNEIDAVYSTGSDLAIPVACRISERLGLPHFVSSSVAYTCNHKDAMRKALTQDCRGNIPFQVLQEVSRIEIEYPVIMKPSDSQGQRGIYLVESQSEAEKYFEGVRGYSREGKVIVEKYIDGPEVSVNGYLVNGSLRFAVASDRDTWPQYTGLIHRHVVPGVSFNSDVQEKIVNTLQDACNRIGILNGPVYFQMKIMDNEPFIIEMTPRLDGCHMWNVLARSTGVNLMKLTFEHLLYDNTSELNNLRDAIAPMELVFWCSEPNRIMLRKDLTLPEDALYHYYYYEDGERIRPVNGKFDKIGYYIRSL